MNVAVTGANGHAGANLVRQLLDDGYSVRAIVHEGTTAVDGLSVEKVRADVALPRSLRKAFKGTDAVIHLAARISIMGDPDGAVHACNVVGAGNVAQAAFDEGVGRLVHVSSVHAFDLAAARVVHEGSPRAHAGCAAYDHSKLLGEAAVRRVFDAGLNGTILNPTGIIGPFDFGPSRMGQVLLDLARGRLPALVRGAFDWVDVRDVSRAAISALDHGGLSENHLIGGHRRSVRDVAQTVADAIGGRPPRLSLPIGLARMGIPFARVQARRDGVEPKFTSESLDALQHGPTVDSSKSAKVLGHAPRPFEDSVSDALEWFQSKGYL
jgi:dihydroflavonol-4-reductase